MLCKIHLINTRLQPGVQMNRKKNRFNGFFQI
jgi:hypothetical protein